jgi:YggT family protein
VNFDFGNPLCAIGQIYVIFLIARAILSWFPIRSDSPFATIVRFLNAVTEPVLAPLRRIIPPMGMFDISFLVAFLIIQIVVVPVLCSLKL